jgi:hypothetical protein
LLLSILIQINSNKQNKQINKRERKMKILINKNKHLCALINKNFKESALGVKK